jgi:pimeloyl-ACP methyl ester carboxylesterase
LFVNRLVFKNTTAFKVNEVREDVTFQSGEVQLSGTILKPEKPKGVIVFLHGSGALNRYSFGPFPHFFLSRGFAILIYDKRGTGASTGDLSKATLDDLTSDGRAAVQFVKQHTGVSKIGLCGTSQGGFLAAAVAANNPDIDFIINLYGMYVPVWQQELYSTETKMRAAGFSKTEITEALEFMNLEFEVGRTAGNPERWTAALQQAKTKKWFDSVPNFFADVNELRYYWRTLYSYDPAAALEKVHCPVLALFGDLDNSTPVHPSVSNMQAALQKKLTVRIFPKGIHGLLEGETGTDSEIPGLKRFVPGLFETLTQWLQ